MKDTYLWIRYEFSGSLYNLFHDRPKIWLLIKTIPDEFVIAFHMTMSQIVTSPDVFSIWWPEWVNKKLMCDDRLFHHHLWFYYMYIVWETKMYVLSWRTVCSLPHAICWCILPSLQRNWKTRHRSNLFVSTYAFRHSSTYIMYTCMCLYTYTYVSNNTSLLIIYMHQYELKKRTARIVICQILG